MWLAYVLKSICLCAVLLSECVNAKFFSVDSHVPPFLYRNNDERNVIQWDTGDIARDVALSDGVVVNYQGSAQHIFPHL